MVSSTTPQFTVKRGTQVDRGRLFGILNLFNGQVFETTIPPKVEAALVKGWED